jgi:hypothetical protein
MILGGLLISCLSWVQLARVKVLLYPYHPAFVVLAAVIADAGEDAGQAACAAVTHD